MKRHNRTNAPRVLVNLRVVLALTLIAASNACVGASPVTEPRVRLTATHVTESLAATLTPDGRFVLASAVVNPPGQLTEDQAKSIASRFVRDVAWSRLGAWTAEHGAPIDANALAPCDRALYAADPYVSLNGPQLSEVTVRTFGAHWVIPMCGRSGQLQLVITLSALATEMAVNLGSTRPLPWERANISSYGFPIGAQGSVYSPEGAALYAFQKTGKRVASVPELIMSPMPMSPVLVRWRLDLDAPITVRGSSSGVSRERATLLVGFAEIFKSAGLLDRDPRGEAPIVSWTDAVSRTAFTVVLSQLAPVSPEIVTRVHP